jgi:hypothetical protein
LLLYEEDDRKMVKEYVVLAIILTGLFSGCIGEESYVGKYVDVESNKTYFILYEDGTFNQFYEKGDVKSASGTYRIADGQIVMTYLPFGNVHVLTKNGSFWNKDNGAKYVKE